MVWAEGAGQELGAEEGEAVGYREGLRLAVEVGDGGHLVGASCDSEGCILDDLQFGYR